jgi:trk system potassium uptake protein
VIVRVPIFVLLMGDLFNIKIALKVISRNLFILSAAFLVNTGIALLYAESLSTFLYPFLLSLIVGLFLYFLTRNENEDIVINRRDAYMTVTISWLIISLVGSLPYLISGSIPSFIDALFESVSGFTTTGSSILVDIEVLPKSVLFWRSLTHWIGGIGIIVLVIVIMPTLRMGSYHLFTLESSLQDKIKPRIKAVGRRLVLIYVSLTAMEVFFLMLGKMNLFESVCHAFGTVATGGFSPKNTSIAEYSPYIQYVITVFMLLAGVNFVVHYYLFKFEFKRVKSNEELRFYLRVVGVIGLAITLLLYLKTEKTLEESFRESFFQVVSIITCTGFATADYLLWPVFGWALIFVSMFLGGCTGSTAGGVKMARYLVLYKNLNKLFRQSQSRNVVVPIKLNQNHIGDDTNRAILTFMAVYFMVFLAGSILLVFLGNDVYTSAGSVATCMAGIGPGLGTVGPVSNFAHLSDITKIILSILMLLGRLEIYTIVLLFSRKFWVK